MNETAALFYRIGEPYAAGLFEEPDKGYFYRHSLALARYLEALPPAKYEGEQLYPAKKQILLAGLHHPASVFNDLHSSVGRG